MSATEQTRVTLFEIAADYRALIEALEAEDYREEHDPETGEVTEDPARDLLAEVLDAMEGTLADKFERCAAVVRFHRQQEQIADEEIDRVSARKKVLCNRADRMEARMLAAMQFAGLTKVEWPLGGCSVRKPSLHVEVTGPVPLEYLNRGEFAELLDEALDLLWRVACPRSPMELATDGWPSVVGTLEDDVRAFLGLALRARASHLAKAPVRKAEIAKALKAKEEVLGAALVPGSPSLVIR